MKPVIFQLGQFDDGKWFCKDKRRPGLIVADNGKGVEFDFPQDALQACCDAGDEYDKLKKSRVK